MPTGLHWQKGRKQRHESSTTAQQMCSLRREDLSATEFIVVHDRQEPKLYAPQQDSSGSLLTMIGVAMARPLETHTPFSYQLRQQHATAMWFRALQSIRFVYFRPAQVVLMIDVPIVSMVCDGIASSLDKIKTSLLHIISERSDSSVKCETSPSLTLCLEVPSPAPGLSAPFPACSVAR